MGQVLDISSQTGRGRCVNTCDMVVDTDLQIPHQLHILEMAEIGVAAHYMFPSSISNRLLQQVNEVGRAKFT